jgi:hypothetical protein
MRRLAQFNPNGEIDFPRQFKDNGKVPHLVLRKYNCEKEGLTRDLSFAARSTQSDYEITEEAIQSSSL